METSVLENAGLTKNEIKVYLALLELGKTSSGPLIKKSGINSSKVYESLDRLQKKGMVSYAKETNKRFFKAAEPARLVDYIDERKRNLEIEKNALKQIIPELDARKKRIDEEKQEAVIYQGLKGYKTLLETMLKDIGPKGNYLAFASGMLKQVLGDYWYIFQKKKKKLGINAKCLWDPNIRNQKDYLKEYYGKGRFLSEGHYISPADFWIFNDKVIQISYESKPIFAVLITSKGLARSYKDLFETIWKTAKR